MEKSESIVTQRAQVAGFTIEVEATLTVNVWTWASGFAAGVTVDPTLVHVSRHDESFGAGGFADDESTGTVPRVSYLLSDAE